MIHSYEFTGIREAYDYLSHCGSHVIYVTFGEENLLQWLAGNPPDLWATECDCEFLSNNHPGHLILVYRDRLKYLVFRTRWYSEHEYQVCHEPHDRHSLDYLLDELSPRDDDTRETLAPWS